MKNLADTVRISLNKWIAAHGLCLLLIIAPELSSAKETPPFAQRLTRLLNPALNADEQKLESLQERLDELPPLSPGHSESSIGFHSRFQPEQNTPLNVAKAIREGLV